MTLNKLKKLITIWLNEVINDKVIIWQVGSGKSGENHFYQTYDISSDDDSWRGKRARLYINTYEDINNNVTFFTIGFDGEIGETKCDNHGKLTVYPNGETEWLSGSKPGDTVISYKHFSNEDIIKLKHMIDNADKTISDYLEKHPKFDMDEKHIARITGVTFKKHDTLEIKFIANNQIFDSKNKLYIGFEIEEKDYVFEVTEKHISISNPFSFKFDKVMINPFYEYEYVATFIGDVRPSEEEILNATFRWVVSNDIIKKANRDACYSCYKRDIQK